MTGRQLQALLKARGLTQMDLVRALGVEQSTVYRWVHGERRISKVTALAITQLLNKKARTK